MDMHLNNQKQVDFISKLEARGDMNKQAANAKEALMVRQQSSVQPKAEDGSTDTFCTLHYNDAQYRLPILIGNDGNKLLDIQALYAQSKLFCYDPGYTITGSCVSAISNATAEGKLYYRGYDVEDLTDECTFIEVCFILLYGNKPTQKALTEFNSRICDEMLVHQKILDFYKGFQFNAHPMSIMCSVVAGLSSFLHGNLDIRDSMQRELSAIKLIAKMPVLAAIAFRTSAGLPVV